MPSVSGLAQRSGGGLDRHVLGVDAAYSRDLPSEDYGNTQHPPASMGPRIALAHPLISSSAIIGSCLGPLAFRLRMVVVR